MAGVENSCFLSAVTSATSMSRFESVCILGPLISTPVVVTSPEGYLDEVLE